MQRPKYPQETAMFIEGEVEIKMKDASTHSLDEHDLKLWLQRGFKDMACYRISDFRREADQTLRATVALALSAATPEQQGAMLQPPPDAARLRDFVEHMFVGKGRCRCVGDPQIRQK